MTEAVQAPTSGESARTTRALRKWAFLLIPAIGFWEILAHVVQVRSVVSDDDWKNARGAVESMWKEGDLVVFAPEWTDPLGREFFGDRLAGIPEEARADESRFPRAFEVSIRGEHAPELADWKRVDRRSVGPVTITTLENPAPAHVVDDLLAHAKPDAMSVSHVDGANESECHWVHGSTTSGGLGMGPATPGDRFACSGGSFVGVSLIHDLADKARRCFFSPSGGGSGVLRVKFADVAFAGALHGHAGLAQFQERDRTGPPVNLVFKANGRTLGKIVHNDGDGWKSFELSTTDLQGQKGELVAEISSTANRQYCFEADTR